MNKIITHLDLDLASSNEYKIINAQQLDNNTRRLEVNLFHEGKIYDISNVTRIELQGQRGDKLPVKTTLSHTGNTIIVDFDDTILGAKGVCKLKIALYASNQLLSSFPFLIRVDENVYDENGIIITPEYSELEEALKKVEDIETKEIARVEAENKRVSSEQTRNNAESTRQKSEQSRVTAETNRVSAESTRQTNETNRKTNETARVSAESTRNNNEESRKKNETNREKSEQSRVTAETTRETNEFSRKSSESARIENENKRISAESVRNNAETERVKAEESRVSSENERRNSEASRVSDFTNMKNELSEIVENNKNINIEAITPDDEHYQVKVTDKNGVSKTSTNLLSKLSIGTVETGEYNEDPTVNITGKFGEQKLNFRLPIGKPFKIKKTYSSIADMNQNIDTDLELYEFCMINTGNVEDEDTAKLYMREVNGAQYITDLSGAQGIQGIKGETGATPNFTIGTVTTGTEESQATATISGTAENPILNLTIPRGMTGKVENISGASIPYASSDDEKSIKDVVDRIDTTIAEKAPITHTHTTVNGHTVESDVPSNAVFTDTNTWRPQPDWNATSGDAMIKNKPTIGNAASKTVRTLTTVGNSGWTGSVSTEQQHVPDMAFMAYWNGAYNGTASNLVYCNKGAFGSIVTKNIGDYAASNHTHTANQVLASLGLGDYNTASTWGTINATNGYTLRCGIDQAGGGGITIGEKSGQTSIQIDGEFYASEGQKRLAHIDEIPSIDSALSSTSTNPVQNKVVNTNLGNKMNKANPSGTGSLIMNGTGTGTNEVCLGNTNNKSNGYCAATIGGSSNETSGNSHAIIGGQKNKIVAANSIGSGILGGNSNTINGVEYSSIICGNSNEIKSTNNTEYQNSTIVGGNHNSVTNHNCVVIGGSYNTGNGDSSVCAGFKSISSDHQVVIGHYNNTSLSTGSVNGWTGTGSNTLFCIGNGSESTRSNAFRVNANGATIAKAAYSTTGADYAEFFEWVDGNTKNEDRRGLFVTIDGDKIKKASEGDYILGIVSAMPSVIGNYDEEWMGHYLLDDFGAFIEETYEEERMIIDEETQEEKTIKIQATRWKENPDYNSELEYIPREKRKEWSPVGMLGALNVRDDGSCQVNGFCKVMEGGIATSATSGYRVIKRINDNIIKVLFK